MSAPTIRRPRIRRAEAFEAGMLSAICKATFTETFGHLYPPADLAAFLSETYAPDRLRAELEDADTAVWFAELEGRVVGYAQAGPCGLPHPDVSETSGELKRLYVLAEVQNAGLGGRLFDAALAWLDARRPPDIWIGVWSENHGAQRFYRRRGFEKAGEYDFAVGRTLDREFILRGHRQ